MEIINEFSVNPRDAGRILFLPNSSSLVCSGWNSEVTVWDAVTGNLQTGLGAQSHHSGWNAVSADGSTLITITGTKESPSIKLWDTTSWENRSSISITSGHTLHFAIDSDTTKIARLILSEREIEIWNIQSGILETRLKTEGFDVFAFHPLQLELAVLRTETIEFYNTDTWDLIKRLTCKHLLQGSYFSYSPDGRWLIAGTDIQIIHLMHSQTLEVEREIGTWVDAAIFSPDGKWLAVARDYVEVCLYDIETGQKNKGVVPFLDVLTNLTFSSDGTLLACGGGGRGGGVVSVIRLTD